MRSLFYSIAIFLLTLVLQVQGAAHIQGQVLNGSLDSTVVADIEIKLLAFRGHNEQLNFSRVTSTDARGQYQFREISIDSTTIYYATASLDGITYYSAPIHARDLMNNFTDRPIIVYQKTTDPTAMDIPMHHIFFQADGERGFVREVVVVRNFGTRAIIASSSNPEIPAATLRIGLPAAAEQVQLVSGLDPSTTRIADHTLLVMDAIVPGSNQFSFVYQIPAHGRQFRLSRQFYNHTSVLSFFTPSGAQQVRTDQLRATGPFTIRDVVYNRYAAENIHAGTLLDLRVGDIGSKLNPIAYLIPGFAIVIFIIAMIGVPGRGRTSATEEPKKKTSQAMKELESERLNLVQSIARLDNQFEAHEINQEYYLEQRQVQFNQLLRLEALKNVVQT